MHTFKPGAGVYVINSTMSGTFFVEGSATIKRVIPELDETYWVHFDADDDPGCWTERFVDPAAQENPAKMVSQLNNSS